MRTNYTLPGENVHLFPWFSERSGGLVAECGGTTTASGAVLIEAVDEDTITAIRKVLPAGARLKIVGSGPSIEPATTNPVHAPARLSMRQLEILALLVEGKSNKAIGRCLGISHFTVRNHLAQIMRDRQVANRHDLKEKCLAGEICGIGANQERQ